MPQYKCIKHQKLMEEKIENNKIQPYCVDCRKNELFHEQITEYVNNEEWYKKEHKRLVKSAYYESVIKTPIKTFFVSLPPVFFFSMFLQNFVSSSVLLTIGSIIPIAFSVIVFCIALFNFKEPTTIYSKPTQESIENKVEIEKQQNKEIVERFKKNLQNEYEIRSTRIDEVDKMEGIQFEWFVAELLEEIGYTNVRVTKQSGDGGVDILAVNLQGETTAIQCKRFKSKVGNGAIQEIFLAKKLNKCKKGMVITNSYFTKPAFEAALKSGIELWNRKRLIEEMKKQEPRFTWEEYLKSFYILPKGKQRIN